MAKQEIKYSDLSTKELEVLKDIYIDLKVKSMSNNDLKDFVIENISLQIKNTIGNDEELEAWREMEEFFKDQFDKIISDIQSQMRGDKAENIKLNNERIKTDIENNGENKKVDMWED
tara:strand:- start:404 stop:754 length:351 start_codon:yes stop_codon:yes gene_type:complete